MKIAFQEPKEEVEGEKNTLWNVDIWFNFCKQTLDGIYNTFRIGYTSQIY